MFSIYGADMYYESRMDIETVCKGKSSPKTRISHRYSNPGPLQGCDDIQYATQKPMR